MTQIEVSEVIEELDKAFNSPGKIRVKLIKLIFPEIIEVADKLREAYWSK